MTALWCHGEIKRGTGSDKGEIFSQWGLEILHREGKS